MVYIHKNYDMDILHCWLMSENWPIQNGSDEHYFSAHHFSTNTVTEVYSQCFSDTACKAVECVGTKFFFKGSAGVPSYLYYIL